MYRDEFSKTNLSEGGDISAYFNRLSQLQSLLKESNAPITDGELIIHILNNFPASFNIFIIALRAQSIYLTNVTLLKSCLLQEWRRRLVSGEMGIKSDSLGLSATLKCRNFGKNHDYSKCWADGGGDVVNRPSWYKPKKVKAKANSVELKKNNKSKSTKSIIPKTITFMANVNDVNDRFRGNGAYH
jgi:hypothetical protein